MNLVAKIKQTSVKIDSSNSFSFLRVKKNHYQNMLIGYIASALFLSAIIPIWIVDSTMLLAFVPIGLLPVFAFPITIMLFKIEDRLNILKQKENLIDTKFLVRDFENNLISKN